MKKASLTRKRERLFHILMPCKAYTLSQGSEKGSFIYRNARKAYSLTSYPVPRVE